MKRSSIEREATILSQNEGAALVARLKAADEALDVEGFRALLSDEVALAADMEAQLAYYRKTFGNASGRPFEIANPILSQANGLAVGTRHRLATVALGDAKVIEVYQFPAAARQRITPPGGLAPGIAMVTFGYARLDRCDLNWVGRAAPSGVAPTLPPARRRRRAAPGS